MGANSPDDFLGIYLNDHLAGATAGVELSGRLARSVDGADGTELAALYSEIRADRGSLIANMKQLGIDVQRHKAAFAWLGEKLARLKLNGALLRRSPLSTVVELETMTLGVRGKSLAWHTLRLRAATDVRLDAGSIDDLIERADSQLVRLEVLRERAAKAVIGG